MHPIGKRFLAALLPFFLAPGVGHYWLGSHRAARRWALAHALCVFGLVIACTGSYTRLIAIGVPIPAAILLATSIDTFRGRLGISPPLGRVLAYALVEATFYGTPGVFVSHFFVSAYKIPSGSMYPSSAEGDSILVSRVTRIPKRGDAIAFRYLKKEYIKRVIGIGGDTVEVRDNVVIINGRALAEQALPDPCTTEPGCRIQQEQIDGNVYAIAVSAAPSPIASIPPQRVESDYVFLLGDNRDLSYDSRQFGPIPVQDIVGYVEYVWWPPSRYGAFPRAR